MMEYVADTVCCGREMVHHNGQFDESESWTCLECGAFITHGQLDEEELESLRENEDWEDDEDDLSLV